MRFSTLLFTWAFALASLASACATRSVSTQRAFIHPGLLHTTKDFERINGFLKANRQPWTTGWDKLAARADADYTARPVEVLCRGLGSECTENYSLLFRDAAAAYANAVHFKITGNETHAEAAGRILDAWSSTLVRIWGTADKFLASGIYGYQLANAGELLRGWSGWGGLPALVDLLADVFYPMNHDFLVNHNGAVIDHYWANWDLANMCAMQAIGILSDNATMYDEANDYFKNGAGNGQIENAVWKIHHEAGSNKPLGQGQEAGRDQGHALLEFSFLGVFAQQAFNQGDDLFGYLDNRILAGAEYVAKYNLGHDVPFATFTNSHGTADAISDAERGGLRPIWELLYAHYDSLKGLNASWSGQMRDLVNKDAGGAEGGGGDYGPNSGGYDQLGFGTLLHRLE